MKMTRTVGAIEARVADLESRLMGASEDAERRYIIERMTDAELDEAQAILEGHELRGGELTKRETKRLGEIVAAAASRPLPAQFCAS